jgi:hypothetical protein
LTRSRGWASSARARTAAVEGPTGGARRQLPRARPPGWRRRGGGSGTRATLTSGPCRCLSACPSLSLFSDAACGGLVGGWEAREISGGRRWSKREEGGARNMERAREVKGKRRRRRREERRGRVRVGFVCLIIGEDIIGEEGGPPLFPISSALADGRSCASAFWLVGCLPGAPAPIITFDAVLKDHLPTTPAVSEEDSLQRRSVAYSALL